MNTSEKQKYIFNILYSIANYITEAHNCYIQNISMPENNLIEFKVYFDQVYYDDILNRIKYIQTLLPKLNIQIYSIDYDTQNFLQLNDKKVKVIMSVKFNTPNNKEVIYETLTILKLYELIQ